MSTNYSIALNASTRLDPYSPDALIVSMHNVPRPGGGSNEFTMTGVTADTLSTCISSLGKTCPNTYLFGAVSPGLALIICGVVFLIVWLFAYCFACCRCCGKCKPRKAPEHGCKGGWKHYCPSATRLVFAIINFALVLSGISYTTTLFSALSGVTTFVNSISTTIMSISTMTSCTTSAGGTYTTLDGSSSSNQACLKYSLDTIKTAGSSLNSGISRCTTTWTQTCTNPAGEQAVSDLYSASSDMSSDSLTSISGNFDKLSTSLNSLDFVSSDLKTQMSSISRAILGVIAALVIVQALLICRYWWSCCMYKATAPISIILNFLLFLLAGIFYLIGTIGSDLCYSPATLLASAIGNADLTWVLTCAINPTTTAPSFITSTNEMINKLLAANATAYKGLSNMYAVINDNSRPIQGRYGWAPLANYATSPYSSSTTFNTYISQTSSMIGSTIALITSFINCQQLDKLFSTLFSSLCNGTVSSIVGLARVLVAASVFLLLQMAIGIDICAWHPGDKKAWVDSEGVVPIKEGVPEGAPVAKNSEEYGTNV